MKVEIIKESIRNFHGFAFALYYFEGDGMRIAVIDGQGGGIGKSLVEKLRKELPEDVEIIALGTNSLATSFMIKAGANEGATGENAIVLNASKVDIIMGAIGIVAANSMLGELTPQMAKAIAESSAKKILLPLNRCNIEIVGVDKSEPLPHLVDKAVKTIKENMKR
jgi:hypothetical protein